MDDVRLIDANALVEEMSDTLSDNPLPKCRNCNYFYQSIYSGICFGHAPYYLVNRMDPACVWFEPRTSTDSSITMTKCGGDSHVGKEFESDQMRHGR